MSEIKLEISILEVDKISKEIFLSVDPSVLIEEIIEFLKENYFQKLEDVDAFLIDDEFNLLNLEAKLGSIKATKLYVSTFFKED